MIDILTWYVAEGEVASAGAVVVVKMIVLDSLSFSWCFRLMKEDFVYASQRDVQLVFFRAL